MLTRARRRSSVCLLAVAVALGGAACGVPTQDRATRIPADDVPYGLGRPTTTSTAVPGSEQAAVTLYVVDGDHLVPVQRTSRQAVDARRVVELLTEPLPDAEAEAGLRRALADADLVASVQDTADAALVDLTEDFSLLPAREQVLALGQVVLSLTALPDIERIRFTLDDAPLPVPTGDGTVSSGLVRRADYTPLL